MTALSLRMSPTPEQVLRALDRLGPSAPAKIRERFVITPPLEPAETLDRLGAATSAAMEGLNALRDRICGGDLREMSRLCRAAPSEYDLVALQPWQDWSTIARPDVVTSGGRPVVVEINGDSPAGLFSLHDALAATQADLLAELGIHVEAEPPRAMRALIETLPLTPGVDRVAVCYWRHEILDAPPAWSYGSFVKALNEHGIDAFHCPLEDLDIDRRGLHHHGDPVTVVYRYFESPDEGREDELRLLRTVFDRAREGLVRVVTGYCGEILASKLSLALLSDDALLAELPPDLAGRLRAHVPWTRVVEPGGTTYFGERISLPDFALAHRRRLLIKPVRGHAGLGITVGAEVGEEEWAAALKAALAAGSEQALAVVQEVHEPDTSPVRFSDADGVVTSVTTRSVDGVFVLDSRPTAVLRRYAVHPGGTVNINPRSGYAPSPVWWQAPGSLG
ncbi:hypothetical protein [Streptomyces hoynatensis]|uniref:Circularly permuted type 2 ATP-grasp protein n=1 Tax=Streptomyces hoynatensis TaxID=1141874 RepID=A0A3A9ZFC6_9ACTN|nr:hypothetical protein [Streptomyces hoynatensis]RKN47013.1 hypothetical protein D7294_02175 [Streptomyces hoynatensis]